MPIVAGFQPSTSGFHFSNSFPHVPLKTERIEAINFVFSLGDASNGLCGGMVYAVCDYFNARLAPPPDTTPPGDGPLFDYVVRRLWESWDVPVGVLRYWALMSPELPDFAANLPVVGAIPSRSSIMINREWPAVKRDLDNNQLAPLGLVRSKSKDPEQLGQNHQVLAYGYDLDGTNLTLQLYDPNAPDRDDVTLSVSLAGTDRSCALSCNTSSNLFCFFRSKYQAATPPDGTPLP
jgi:hypothetical protein